MNLIKHFYRINNSNYMMKKIYFLNKSRYYLYLTYYVILIHNVEIRKKNVYLI